MRTKTKKSISKSDFEYLNYRIWLKFNVTKIVANSAEFSFFERPFIYGVIALEKQEENHTLAIFNKTIATCIETNLKQKHN